LEGGVHGHAAGVEVETDQDVQVNRNISRGKKGTSVVRNTSEEGGIERKKDAGCCSPPGLPIGSRVSGRRMLGKRRK